MKQTSVLVAFLLTLAVIATPVWSQGISIDLGGEDSLTARSIQLLILVTLLSLVPGLAIMITCFPFLVTVLSILRQAIGLQQSPPNMLIVSLALFLTYFIMEPVFSEAWTRGAEPLIAGSIELETAFTEALEPFRVFMASRVMPDTFEALAALRDDPSLATVPAPEAPLSILVPSFMLSEIERAFQIGFLIF